jgi:hypothetical protein
MSELAGSGWLNKAVGGHCVMRGVRMPRCAVVAERGCVLLITKHPVSLLVSTCSPAAAASVC